MSYRRMLMLVWVPAFLLIANFAFAEVPQMINYQGRLSNADGAVVDGPQLIKFKIYGSEAGDDSLWSSGFQTVQVDSGFLDYKLGRNIQLPDELFANDTARFLGITVGVDQEIAPRVRLITAPYAYQALHSDSSSYADHSNTSNAADYALSGGDGLAAPVGPFEGTTILDEEQQLKINNWIGNPFAEWTLCYKSSTDGTPSATFHDQCDNRGPTVTVISYNGYIFGGYLSHSWEDDVNGYFETGDAFIFSINANKKYPLGNNFEQYAVFMRSDRGPCFGGGHDIAVMSDGTVWCYRLHSYCDDGVCSYTSDAHCIEMYGENCTTYVTPDEIEVFRMK
jgi:hypothetical protein